MVRVLLITYSARSAYSEFVDIGFKFSDWDFSEYYKKKPKWVAESLSMVINQSFLSGTFPKI